MSASLVLSLCCFDAIPRKKTHIAASIAAVLLCLLGARAAFGQAMPTTTKLAASSNSVSVRTPVTLTATVTSSKGAVTPGLVKFCNASAKFCEDTAILGTAQLVSNGTAKISVLLGPGRHDIYAAFDGTTKYASSASLPNVETVEVTGTAPRGSSYADLSVSGSPGGYTLKSTVRGFSVVPPTGKVDFIAGYNGKPFASAPLDKSSLNYGFGTPSYYGTPPSGFTTEGDVIGTAPTYVAKGDLNGDGILDLVVGDTAGGQLGGYPAFSILFGDPSNPGKFSTQQDEGYGSLGTVSLVIADFNGDGIPDIANIDGIYNYVYLLSGQYASSNVAGDFPTDLVVADFNKDGLPDLAVENFNFNSRKGSVSVLLNNPAFPGQFMPPISSPIPTQNGHGGTVVADFNSDGFPDIATADGLGHLYVALNDASHPGKFLSPVSYPLPSSPAAPSQIVTGDFNADGVPDIAATTPNGLEVFIGDKAHPGKFLTPVTYPVAAGSLISIAIVDLDGDGILDAAVGISLPPPLNFGLYYGNPANPGTFLPEVNHPIVNPPGSGADNPNVNLVVAGDFSGNGRTDLVGVGGFTISSGSALVTFLPGAVTETATASNVRFYGDYIFAQYAGDADYYDYKSCQLDVQAKKPVAPTIIGIPDVSNVTATSATVSWTTNVLTYGGMTYACNINQRGDLCSPAGATPTPSSIFQKHSFVLTNLTPDRTYSYQVWSSSYFNECVSQTAASGGRYFVTPPQ